MKRLTLVVLILLLASVAFAQPEQGDGLEVTTTVTPEPTPATTTTTAAASAATATGDGATASAATAASTTTATQAAPTPAPLVEEQELPNIITSGTPSYINEERLEITHDQIVNDPACGKMATRFNFQPDFFRQIHPVVTKDGQVVTRMPAGLSGDYVWGVNDDVVHPWNSNAGEIEAQKGVYYEFMWNGKHSWAFVQKGRRVDPKCNNLIGINTMLIVGTFAPEKPPVVIVGQAGAAGAAGATGATGATGAMGPRGWKGDKGDKGDRGERGCPGLNGTSIIYLPPVCLGQTYGGQQLQLQQSWQTPGDQGLIRDVLRSVTDVLVAKSLPAAKISMNNSSNSVSEGGSAWQAQGQHQGQLQGQTSWNQNNNTWTSNQNTNVANQNNNANVNSNANANNLQAH